MKLIFENWRNFRRLNEGVDPRTIEKIESAIRDSGGESYIVGGAVRDELVPNTPESKDVDFLIRNLTYDQIKNSIQRLLFIQFVEEQILCLVLCLACRPSQCLLEKYKDLD